MRSKRSGPLDFRRCQVEKGLRRGKGKLRRLRRELKNFFSPTLPYDEVTCLRTGGSRVLRYPKMQISSRFFNKALNLNHTVIHSAVQTTRRAKFGGVGFEQNVIEVNGRPNLHWQHKCPHCMKTCSVYDHQSGSVSWRAGTFNGEPVYLVYEPARISCALAWHCKGVPSLGLRQILVYP